MVSTRKAYTPLRAIREHCLDCSGGSFKSVQWCPCDGVHSTRCDLWPYRFGMRPASLRAKYGPGLVTPEAMPPANRDEDHLPNGLAAAKKFFREKRL